MTGVITAEPEPELITADEWLWAALSLAVVSTLLTRLLWRFYVKAVEREMAARVVRAGAGGGAGAGETKEGTGAGESKEGASAPPPPLRFDLIGGPGRRTLSERAAVVSGYVKLARHTAVLVYGLAGLAHVSVALFIFARVTGWHLPRPFLWLMCVVFLWPPGAAVLRIWNAPPLGKLAAGALYLLAVACFSVLAEVSGLGLAFLFWVAGVPVAVMSWTMNRKLKSSGTTVLIFVSVIVGGWLTAQAGVRLTGAEGALSAALWLLCLAGAGVLGWLFVQRLRRRYLSRRSSDMTVVLDTFWLFQAEWFALMLAGDYVWLAVIFAASYGSYWLVVKFGLRLRRRFLRPRAPRNLRLLLLRTFGAPARSRRLLERLEAGWRHVGSLQLIAATDLAAATLEPHELLDYVSGRLKDHFVTDAEDAARRAASLDREPDPDGRYRVYGFFCLNENWREALPPLVEQADAVLVDLRDFSMNNEGVLHELGVLVDRMPAGKILLLADDSERFDEPGGDARGLRGVLEQEWAGMCAESPNRHAPAPLRVLRVRRRGKGLAARLGALAAPHFTDEGAGQLLDALYEAAVTPGAGAGREATAPLTPRHPGERVIAAPAAAQTPMSFERTEGGGSKYRKRSKETG